MTRPQLQRLAEARGIQTSYINAAGKKVIASRQSLEAILEALGPIEPAPCEPVIVQWDGKPRRIQVEGPAQLRLESGESVPVKGSTLPRSLFGYHKLEVGNCEALVISSPTKTYS